jgi:hypothetical protein
VNRRLAAWLVLVVGVAMMAAPEAFDMWVRAPRGAQMIGGFASIMTAKNVPVIAGYGRTVLGGFGSAALTVQQAVAHFSGGRHALGYTQAAAFIASHTNLRGLAYMDRELPVLGPPFSTLLSVLYKDQPAFAGIRGLPSFTLFPLFFVVPGLLIAGGAAIFLHRDGRLDECGRPRAATGWARFLAVIGFLVAVAPLLPMPPGFHSIRTVGPHGAAMLDDFAAPINGPGSPPVMSLRTVNEFDGYVAEMRLASTEIVPAVQDAAAAYGSRRISAAQATAFLGSEPSLSLVDRIVHQFPKMYRAFHTMLATMAKDMDDYRAVRALPSFSLFPVFFYVPGGLVFVLALIGLLRGSPEAPAVAAGRVSSGAPAGAALRSGTGAIGRLRRTAAHAVGRSPR